MLSRLYAYVKQRSGLSCAIADTTSSVEHSPGPDLLAKLPNELLAQVIDYFQAKRNAQCGVLVPELLALCLTSKVVSAVATPALYRDFRNAGSAATLGRFLRTITHSPDLAKHVRRMSLTLWPGRPDTTPSQREYVDFLEAIVPFAEEAPFYRRLRKSLGAGTYDAEAAVLLVVVTQLEELAIVVSDAVGAEENVPYVPGYEGGISLVSQLIYLSSTANEGGNRSHKVLSRLKVAFLRLDTRSPHMCPAEAIAPLFGLPRIDIVRLLLYDCNLDTTSAVAIIKSCRALEALSITWQSSLGGENGLNGVDAVLQLDFGEIGEALRQHEGSLEYLTLDTFSRDRIIIAETPPIGSLRSFTKLRTLDIDDRLVYGDRLDSVWENPTDIGDLSGSLRDMLPPGLEVFTFRTRKLSVTKDDILAALASCSCPALRLFTLTVPLFGNMGIDEALEEPNAAMNEISEKTLSSSVEYEYHKAIALDAAVFCFEHDRLLQVLGVILGKLVERYALTLP
ncbi:hypothetical protein LTR85_008237 [Meristemomyces frigidus]|nr:hypothetical protein LTR85_008237 [Meristemomyces frigidus]